MFLVIFFLSLILLCLIGPFYCVLVLGRLSMWSHRLCFFYGKIGFEVFKAWCAVWALTIQVFPWICSSSLVIRSFNLVSARSMILILQTVILLTLSQAASPEILIQGGGVADMRKVKILP